MRSLAALMLCAACSGKGDDSTVTPVEESDTDTDADSDTDTDTDTDTDAALWDADTIFVYAGFGYDADAGEIVDATLGGTPMDNAVFATVMNYDQYVASPDSDTWCMVKWAIPAGPIASNAGYDSSYWLSFDLTDAVVTWSGDDGTSVGGDCDGIGSFMGMPRGDADLATFAATWGVGFGIGPLSDVDSATLAMWSDKIWPAIYAEEWGEWKNIAQTLGSGSMTILGLVPHQSDVFLSYSMGADGSITYDAHTGITVSNVLSHRDAPPTGYYWALSMSGVRM